MNPLRRKVEKTVKRLQGALKSPRRRVLLEESPQGPKDPEQPYTLTNADSSSWASHSPSTSASLALPPSPFSPLPTTSAVNPSPPSPFEAMGEGRSSRVGDLPGSAANPIDLTEEQDGSNRSPADAIDLPAAPGIRTLRSQGPWNCFTFTFPGTMSADAMSHTGRTQWAQFMDNPLMDQILQEQFGQSRPAHYNSLMANDLAKFSARLSSLRCINCSFRIRIQIADVFEQTKNMFESSFLHPCVRCSKCGSWSCVGGDTHHIGEGLPVLRNVASGKTFKTTWCCDDGRRFLIFSLLCGLSGPSEPRRSKRPSRRSSKAHFSTASAVGPEPSSSSPSPSVLKTFSRARKSALSKGTGYGDALPGREKDPSHLRGAGDADKLELYFSALSLVLPSGTRQPATSFDLSPQLAVAGMISKSPMLRHAAELLRLAAIEEMNGRCGSVTALLDFLETLGGHPNTCPLLFRRITLLRASEQLIQLVLGTIGAHGAAAGGRFETGQDLATIFANLAVPCRKFLEASSRFDDPELQKDEGLRSVMQRICRLADWLSSVREQLETCQRLEQAEPGAPPAYPPSRQVRVAEASEHAGMARSPMSFQTRARAAVAEWHRSNCVKEIPDHLILQGYHYAAQASVVEASKTARGRMKALLAQVSSLSADLPEGIFVRHGESRIDALKVLIIGPAGTPYENGLFEFDMFCTANFPVEPPRMHFRTTPDGSASFNPNLYLNGKVCLSLLGTWSGQGWEPNRSTILQLLVSIQAMIFNDQPFYNEPGYEFDLKPERAQQYNETVKFLTVHYAILPWLTRRLAGHNESGKPPREHAPPAPTVPPVPPSFTGLKPQPATKGAPDIPFHSPGSTAVNGHVGYKYPGITDLPKTGPAGDAPGHWMVPQNPAAHMAPDQAVSEAPLSGALTHPLKPAAMLPSQAPLYQVSGATPPQGSTSTKFRPALRAPPNADDPIWGDIARQYFKLRSRSIMETVLQWEQNAAAKNSNPKMTESVQKLTRELTLHGFLN